MDERDLSPPTSLLSVPVHPCVLAYCLKDKIGACGNKNVWVCVAPRQVRTHAQKYFIKLARSRKERQGSHGSSQAGNVSAASMLEDGDQDDMVAHALFSTCASGLVSWQSSAILWVWGVVLMSMRSHQVHVRLSDGLCRPMMRAKKTWREEGQWERLRRRQQQPGRQDLQAPQQPPLPRSWLRRITSKANGRRAQMTWRRPRRAAAAAATAAAAI